MLIELNGKELSLLINITSFYLYTYDDMLGWYGKPADDLYNTLTELLEKLKGADANANQNV